MLVLDAGRSYHGMEACGLGCEVTNDGGHSIVVALRGNVVGLRL